MATRYLIYIFFLGLLSCSKAPENTAVPARAASLLAPEHLSEMIENGKTVKIIDVRDSAEFAGGHLPAALRISRSDMEDKNHSVKGMMADKNQMVAWLSKAGVAPGDLIVIYDNKGNPDASRLWWVLEFYGHKNKALLDGGLLAWKEKGFAVTDKTTQSKPSIYSFNEEAGNDLRAGWAEVQKALSDTNCVLIDARSPDEYAGTEKSSGYSRLGHIPGSVSIDYANNFDYANGGRFKTNEELKEIYKNISPDKKIICYCKSGVRSSQTVYVLTELLGYKNVQNYDGSWLEWSAREDLPVE